MKWQRAYGSDWYAECTHWYHVKTTRIRGRLHGYAISWNLLSLDPLAPISLLLYSGQKCGILASPLLSAPVMTGAPFFVKSTPPHLSLSLSSSMSIKSIYRYATPFVLMSYNGTLSHPPNIPRRGRRRNSTPKNFRSDLPSLISKYHRPSISRNALGSDMVTHSVFRFFHAGRGIIVNEASKVASHYSEAWPVNVQPLSTC